ncbi:hypothetical protein X798_03363 [Onchocerca flexuosa]|uniref:Uncharacterized protein n=1 Tax=Onchocerca flexuosa TaxID=387005 RepID=A0A238BWI5_9BILA|nr:hypothetical protein X798_03363 [Onchocerca flexuosa]
MTETHFFFFFFELLKVHSVGKYIHIMSNFPVQEDVHQVAEKQSSQKESKKKKLDKIKLPNKLQSNNMPKKRQNEQFSVTASLLGTSKVTHSIVEITQDSTLGFPKSPSKDLFQESSSTSWPLSKTKCVKAKTSGAGSGKDGPFSIIKENILKKQKDKNALKKQSDDISFDELHDALPS